MKKILYLSQVYPYPADGGGKIKTLNTLKALSKEYKIFAIFVSEKNPTNQELQYLKKLGIKVKVFYSPLVLLSVKNNILYLAQQFVKGIPHYVFQYTYKPAFPFIRKTIDSFKPDIIHVDHINMTQYLKHEKKELWVLEQHNLEHYLMWSRFIHTKKITRKIYLLIEAVLTYVYERKTIKRFDHVFAISDEESARMKRLFKIQNISTQPLVYKTSILKKKRSKNPKILFLGMITWPPNEDAVEWFLEKMFGPIQKKIPNIEFHVVGKINPDLVRKMPELENVYLHGHQVSLTRFLKKADVFVLPFRMGGGVRIKALTALANGIPVVSTPLGVEGLKVTHNRQCLIAKNPESFVEQTIKIINSKTISKRLGKNGLKYIKNLHGENQNQLFLSKYKIISKRERFSRLV